MVADAAPATSPDVRLTLLAHSGDRFALLFDAQGTPGLRESQGMPMPSPAVHTAHRRLKLEEPRYV